MDLKDLIFDVFVFFDKNIFLFLFSLILYYIIFTISFYNISKKIDKDSSKSFLPFINIIYFLELCGLPKYLFLLFVIPYVNLLGIIFGGMYVNCFFAKKIKLKSIEQLLFILFPFIGFIFVALKKDLVYVEEIVVVNEKKEENIVLDVPKYDISPIDTNEMKEVSIDEFFANGYNPTVTVSKNEEKIDDVADITFDYNSLYTTNNTGIENVMRSTGDDINMIENDVNNVNNSGSIDDIMQPTISYNNESTIPQVEIPIVEPVMEVQTVESVPAVEQPNEVPQAEVPVEIPQVEIPIVEPVMGVQTVESVPAVEQSIEIPQAEVPVEIPQVEIPTVEPVMEVQPVESIPTVEQIDEISNLEESRIDDKQNNNLSFNDDVVQDIVPDIYTNSEIEKKLVQDELLSKSKDGFTLDYNSLYNVEDNNTYQVEKVDKENSSTIDDNEFNLSVAAPPNFDISNENVNNEKIQEQENFEVVDDPKITENLVSIDIDEPDTLPVGIIKPKVEHNVANINNQKVLNNNSLEKNNLNRMRNLNSPMVNQSMNNLRQRDVNNNQQRGINSPIVNQPINHQRQNRPISRNNQQQVINDSYNSNLNRGSKFIRDDNEKYTLPKNEKVVINQPTDPNLIANPLSIFGGGTSNGVLRPTSSEAMRNGGSRQNNVSSRSRVTGQRPMELGMPQQRPQQKPMGPGMAQQRPQQRPMGSGIPQQRPQQRQMGSGAPQRRNGIRGKVCPKCGLPVKPGQPICLMCGTDIK